MNAAERIRALVGLHTHLTDENVSLVTYLALGFQAEDIPSQAVPGSRASLYRRIKAVAHDIFTGSEFEDTNHHAQRYMLQGWALLHRDCCLRGLGGVKL